MQVKWTHDNKLFNAIQ